MTAKKSFNMKPALLIAMIAVLLLSSGGCGHFVPDSPSHGSSTADRPPAPTPGRGEDSTSLGLVHAKIIQRAKAIESQLIEWRRDIHAHPELGNFEVRTARLVAAHLRRLGLTVRTGIAGTGVVAVLEGASPGSTVALRADMDALPVKDNSGLPFASTQRGKRFDSEGFKEVDVMHACGHDAHTAILMATAEILAGLRTHMPGKVVFYFQPAEEGPSDFVPDGKKTWGAKRMIDEGVMDEPRPAAVFGLHAWAGIPAGRIGYRAGPFMAASDNLDIHLEGRQTHAGRPWDGIDPITLSAQVLLGLQLIPSRQINPYANPSLISFGVIKGGERNNIIPESVDLKGTVRSYDQAARKAIHGQVRRTVEKTAESVGGSAKVGIVEKYDPTINDTALTNAMLPTLEWATEGDLAEIPAVGGAEDFSFFAQKVPGLFVFLGITPRDQDMAQAAPNHSPRFYLDESALVVGVRVMAGFAVDYLYQHLP